MDALDRRILREVQRDCSRSAGELADRCGTTESTALRRLRKLRKDGIIRAEVAVIDGTKTGRGLLLLVTVRLERDDCRSANAFRERILSHPDVMQFYFVTGTPDYVILLSARNMEDYYSFVEEYLVADPQVVLADTNVVIRPLKMGMAIPIDEPAGSHRA